MEVFGADTVTFCSSALMEECQVLLLVLLGDVDEQRWYVVSSSHRLSRQHHLCLSRTEELHHG